MLDNSKDVPAQIQIVNSPSVVSMYSPIWNQLEPLNNMSFTEPRKMCVSFNVNFDSSEDYGWKLKDCDKELPVICETFGCLKGLIQKDF